MNNSTPTQAEQLRNLAEQLNNEINLVSLIEKLAVALNAANNVMKEQEEAGQWASWSETCTLAESLTSDIRNNVRAALPCEITDLTLGALVQPLIDMAWEANGIETKN